VEYHALVVATEHDPQYLEAVRARFGQHHNIRVHAVDRDRPDLDGLRSERFDTVLCLNVLEYLEHDDDALATFASLLPPGARVVLQVPAMPRLYGALDRAVGHLRRYDRDELRAKLLRQGFAVEMARYVNLPGLFGWYLNSRMLRRTAVPGVQARLATLFLPCCASSSTSTRAGA
jgi:SAM-dependent methyltransferase